MVAGLVAVPTLGVHGAALLGCGRRRRGHVLRGFAEMTAAATLAVYAWGAWSMFVDETAASDACQRAVGPAHAWDVAAYETSFFPLRFGCRVDGVGTYEAVVPEFVNPMAFALAASSLVLVVLARRAERATPTPSTARSVT